MNNKAVVLKASLVLFISTYTMQWLSLGWSYLSSSDQDLLMPKPAAYILHVSIYKLKVLSVTSRENNHTLCICFVLVFFFCVYIAVVLDSSCTWIQHIDLLALHTCQWAAAMVTVMVMETVMVIVTVTVTVTVIVKIMVLETVIEMVMVATIVTLMVMVRATVIIVVMQRVIVLVTVMKMVW